MLRRVVPRLSGPSPSPPASHCPLGRVPPSRECPVCSAAVFPVGCTFVRVRVIRARLRPAARASRGSSSPLPLFYLAPSPFRLLAHLSYSSHRPPLDLRLPPPSPSPLLFLAILVGLSEHIDVVISLARPCWGLVNFLTWPCSSHQQPLLEKKRNQCSASGCTVGPTGCLARCIAGESESLETHLPPFHSYSLLKQGGGS